MTAMEQVCLDRISG